jgi:DNA-directed RNA polymerase subunit H (RpoH/RPB5)
LYKRGVGGGRRPPMHCGSLYFVKKIEKYLSTYIITPTTTQMLSQNAILSIYNSRKTIIDLLFTLDYDVTDYENFSINEIDSMTTARQLDILLTNPKTNQKTYVKYYQDKNDNTLAKQIRPVNLDEIIEDLYQIENVLTKSDTLVVIIDTEPNDTIIAKLKYIYEQDGIFVVIHSIKRLQYNILNHKLVPQCFILDDAEITKLKKDYNLQTTKQLPEISRFDPQALAMCIRPGQVCRFIRNSETAMSYNYYRVCV